MAPSSTAALSDVMPLALLNDALAPVLPSLAALHVVAHLARVDAVLAFPMPPLLAALYVVASSEQYDALAL